MSKLLGSPLAQLTLARVRQYMREPEAIFWTFFFPIVLATALGIAFRNRAPAPVPVAVEAHPGAGKIVAALRASGRAEAELLPAATAAEALRSGDVLLVVAATDSGLVYRYDAGRADARFARLAVDDALQRAAGRTDPTRASDELVHERGGRYIDFLIPGLIAFNLLGTGLWGVGFSIVRMRTGKLLKRFLATPMRKGEFLLSFMLARLVFLLAELAAILVFAWLVFDVAVQGSLLSFLFIALLGAVTFSGLGLLVASRAQTIDAVSGLMNLVSVPMWVLSGVFFSSEHFPDAIQPLIKALPLTALVDALRAVMNEGATLAATALPVGIVVLWGFLCFGGALAMFRWR